MDDGHVHASRHGSRDEIVVHSRACVWRHVHLCEAARKTVTRTVSYCHCCIRITNVLCYKQARFYGVGANRALGRLMCSKSRCSQINDFFKMLLLLSVLLQHQSLVLLQCFEARLRPSFASVVTVANRYDAVLIIRLAYSRAIGMLFNTG